MLDKGHVFFSQEIKNLYRSSFNSAAQRFKKEDGLQDRIQQGLAWLRELYRENSCNEAFKKDFKPYIDDLHDMYTNVLQGVINASELQQLRKQRVVQKEDKKEKVRTTKRQIFQQEITNKQTAILERLQKRALAKANRESLTGTDMAAFSEQQSLQHQNINEQTINNDTYKQSQHEEEEQKLQIQQIEITQESQETQETEKPPSAKQKVSASQKPKTLKEKLQALKKQQQEQKQEFEQQKENLQINTRQNVKQVLQNIQFEQDQK